MASLPRSEFVAIQAKRERGLRNMHFICTKKQNNIDVGCARRLKRSYARIYLLANNFNIIPIIYIYFLFLIK